MTDCLPSLIGFIGKGGSGKSTLLLSTAAALIETGTSVVIADLDPANGSTARWPELRRHAVESGRTDLVDVSVVAQAPYEGAADTLNRAIALAATLSVSQSEALGAPSPGKELLGRTQNQVGKASEPKRIETEAAMELSPSAPPLILVDLPGGDGSRLDGSILERLDAAILPVEATAMAVGATRRLVRTYGGAGNPRLRLVVNRWRHERRRSEAVAALGEGCLAHVAVRDYVMHQDAYMRGLGVTEAAPEHNASDDIRALAAEVRAVARVMRERGHELPRLGMSGRRSDA